MPDRLRTRRRVSSRGELSGEVLARNSLIGRLAQGACRPAILCGVLFLASCGDLPAEPTPAAALVSVTVAPAVVVGGNPVQLSVTLSTEAPAVGARIELTSSDSAALVPSSLVVADGSRSGSVAVATSQVSAERSVTLSGSYGGVSQSVALRITP